MKIYVTTSNSHVHLLSVFQYLMNTFWLPNPEVTVLGYKPPTFKLSPNFRFVSMGKQKGGVKKWSTDLRKVIEKEGDEFFIYLMEDFFFTAPVDTETVESLLSLIRNDKSIGRIELANVSEDRLSGEYCSLKGGISVRKFGNEAEYRIDCQPSIWRTEYMLTYLENDITPWEFELDGSERAKNDGHKILAVGGDDYPIKHVQAVVRGDFNNVRFGSLPQEYIDDMVDRKLIRKTRRGWKVITRDISCFSWRLKKYVLGRMKKAVPKKAYPVIKKVLGKS